MEQSMTLHEALEELLKGPPKPRPPKTAEQAIARDIKEDMEGVPGSRLTPSARMELTEMLRNAADRQR